MDESQRADMTMQANSGGSHVAERAAAIQALELDRIATALEKMSGDEAGELFATRLWGVPYPKAEPK